MLQNVTTVRQHEGEKAPSTYDVGSLDSESQPEKDDTLFTNSATNVIPATGGQVKDDEEQVVKATTRSKSSLIPSPTLEEPTASDSPKGSDDVVPLQLRHRREYGSVVTMGNSNDDSDEYWVAISRASSPSNRDDRSIPLLSSGEFEISFFVLKCCVCRKALVLIENFQELGMKRPAPLRRVSETA